MALLGLLDREPSHGYDLKRDYDTYFGRGRPLPYGQAYATLSRLARDGKAMVGDAEPGAGPDRKRYTITESGRSEVEVWLAEPIPAEPNFQTDLFVKVVLSLMLGRPAEEYLDIQRGVRLAVGQRPAPAEIRVVVTLQVVTVTGFAIKKSEEGHRYAHTSENTLRVYVRSIDLLQMNEQMLLRASS